MELMGIGKNISGCVFIKEGDASVLGRSSMSRGISDVMGSGSSCGISLQKRVLQ